MRKQLEFKKVKGWGGKRKNAGRKNRSGQKAHVKRETINFKKPLGITLKFNRVSLRNFDTLKAFRHAVQQAKKFSLHVLHYSIQNDHIHLVVEARDNDSLERGMKSLCGRLGKIIRKALGGRGPVFKHRYHLHVLKTPTEVKRAIEYVLLNTAKHMKVIEHIDSFCSGFAFKNWPELIGRRFTGKIRDDYEEFARDLAELSSPQSWLASVGWMRAR